ncbi:PREDICTED: uncharacterized protein LOC109323771 [Crocodylus porosus]|uniref:uncharacterized protein LOC109323771 n=1 Tax=Crocodylus porosus TaxID=8502 RepID=UPI00093D2A31|nr:PREDICTED: uncharacterized protein LOC109323771 [Crocodylus porosus]
MKRSHQLLPQPTVSLIEKEEPRGKSDTAITQENPYFSRRGSYYLTKNMNKNISFKHHKIIVHDAAGLKNFWENIIEKHAKQQEGEETRLNRSALNKLRHEWAQRLEGRIKMLQNTGGEQKEGMGLLSFETFHPTHKTAA